MPDTTLYGIPKADCRADGRILPNWHCCPSYRVRLLLKFALVKDIVPEPSVIICILRGKSWKLVVVWGHFKVLRNMTRALNIARCV